MSRSQRLLSLIQILRCHRYPVTGKTIASELGISLRTLYRDIASLQAQGAEIEGDPGLGYVMRPGFMLPPLMFSQDEIEALVLGARLAIKRVDPCLAAAANNAISKIRAVLPKELQDKIDDSPLLAGPTQVFAKNENILSLIRDAIRNEFKINMTYQNVHKENSSRTVWPIALGFFDHTRVLAAWCEEKKAFRHFRLDRILSLTITHHHYPQRRALLMAKWKEQENILPK